MPDSTSYTVRKDNTQGIFPQLYQLLETRMVEGRPQESYTSKLMQEGLDAVLKKFGEEAIEVILAAKNQSHQDQVHEISDLCFHLLVLMVKQRISLSEIEAELKRRFGESGLAEKVRRNLSKT